MRDFSIQEIRNKIKVDDSRDDLLTYFGKKTLGDRYRLPDESYQDVFARAAVAFSNGDDALAQRLYDYASKQWFMFATPLISNGGTSRGLPISCFLNYVEDSIEGLAENFTENAFLATKGGGIGSYWGHVRSIGQKTSKGVETPGAISFMHVVDAQMLAYHQGTTRRGAAAVYMDMSHPEIKEFIAMRVTTGGDIHRKNENLHHGVCITDKFMEAVEQDLDWELIDPHSLQVVEVVKARALWISILTARVKLGEPYLYFVDTTNKALPQAQKDLGLYVHHSNLCTEITLPTNASRTAVCCLSSINLAKFREWNDVSEQFVADLITMLDNVLEVFIEKAPPQLWRAVNSAKLERSIGLGTLGWHTLLQQESIVFGEQASFDLNELIYSKLKRIADKRTRELAIERGEPDDLKETGIRNAHLFSIAPNASSSIICGGVSPSVEPLAANAFAQKTQSGTHGVYNPALIPVLEKYGKNDDDTWSSIITNRGSVQHLDFMSDYDKAVFRTAIELNQEDIIDLAAQRQQYICQAQSINVFFPADVDKSVLHQVHMSAWKKGLKSLYYLRSESVKSTEVVTGKTERRKRMEVKCTGEVCTMCEG